MCSAELLHRALDVGVGLVDLVDRDDDRHFRGARVVDGLDRLRHDRVVRGDDQHGDIGHAGASGAHRGKRLVARSIEERDLLAFPVHLIGADVLGDAAELLLGDVRAADRVEQRGLAVVDVAHNGDHRRPGNRLRRVLGLRLGLQLGGLGARALLAATLIV